MHTPLNLARKAAKPSFEDRLNAYTLEAQAVAESKSSTTATLGKLCACSMAAGAVLGLAQPAFSAIVYSGPQNIPVVGSVTANFGIPNGVFRFGGGYYVGGYHNAGLLLTTQKRVIFDTAPFALNLPANDMINTAAAWNPITSTYLVLQYGTVGNFLNQRGYIGVRISAGGGNWHYGWIQFDGTHDGATGGTIIDWAYEDQVNTPIRAGQTENDPGPTPAAIPTLSEWGMIILVALLAGLGMHRIRRQKDDDHLAGA